MLYLKPRAVYPDPFRAGNHVLVLCDVHTPPSVQDDGRIGDSEPHASNNRAPAAAVLAAAAGVDPSFAVEQQYTLLDPGTRLPLGEQQKRCLANRTCAMSAAAVLSKAAWHLWSEIFAHEGILAPRLRMLTASHLAAGWPQPEDSKQQAVGQKWPPAQHQPPSSGSYCNVGHAHVAGRQFSEAHMRACLHAGIDITGEGGDICCQTFALRRRGL